VKDFFISYTEVDLAWAEWIAWQLEHAGYEVVLQKWDFDPGSNFVLGMQRATIECERTVAVLSPEYCESIAASAEWAARFAEDANGDKRLLIPVRIADFIPPGLLRPIVYVDLFGLKDEVTAREVLLSGVARGRRKPDVSPAFPATGVDSIPAPRFPGSLPPVWHVPRLHAAHFGGRDVELRAIREDFLAGSRIQVIYGLAGVGKTQLAVEYAHGQSAHYDCIWTVRASDRADAAADYLALIAALGLVPPEGADKGQSIEFARHQLSRRDGWILIIDDASTLQDISGLIPPGSTGHVLITSRSPNWGAVGLPREVLPLSEQDGAAFLMHRTHQAAPDSANTLSRELGGLPLALEQAGAYIEETGIALQEYVSLFQLRQMQVLARGTVVGYPHAVATVWDISVERMRSTTPAAIDLLVLCSFLGPDAIPIWLVRGQNDSAVVPIESLLDDVAWADALARLRSFSLIRKDQVTLSVHPLVQITTRHRLSESERKSWAETAVRLVHDALPPNSEVESTWTRSAQIVSHAVAAVRNAHADGVADQSCIETLIIVAYFYLALMDFRRATDLFEEALSWTLPSFGESNNYSASIFTGMGRAARDLEQAASARQHFERALEITAAVWGDVHPNTGAAFNDLALAVQDVDGATAARQYFAAAARIAEVSLPPNDLRRVSFMINIAGNLRRLGEFSAAERLYERMLSTLRPHAEEIPRQVASVMNHYGSLLLELGHVRPANDLLEEALHLVERIYGPSHPAVAIVLDELVGTLTASDNLAQAREYSERALQIDQQASGQSSLVVADRFNTLGSVLHAQRDFVAARSAFETALAILEESSGRRTYRAAAILLNLGTVLQDMGEVDAAEESYREALSAYEVVRGRHPAGEATIWNNLGTLLLEQGSTTEALAIFQRAHSIVVEAYGRDHPEAATHLGNIGAVHYRNRNRQAAKDMFAQALTILEAKFGPDHPRTALMRNNLARTDQS
jgi:tetratricopeptide (TPR) repeat protein